MSAAENAIKTFTQQYYNALCSAIGASPETFQTAQGSIGLGTTNDMIWQFFDSIPPASINQVFNPGSMNSFAKTYGAVINNLNPQNGDAERAKLGNKYAAWLDFQKDPDNWPKDFDWSDPDAARKLRLALFNRFSVMNGLDQGTTNALRTILKQTDVVSEAIMMWGAADPKYAYTATATTLQQALNNGITKGFVLDSKTASSDTSNAWAKGSVSASYEEFTGEASAEWDRFTQDLQDCGFELNMQFNKLATLVGGPYGRESATDADLTDYKPWYDSPALNTAYKNNNNLVWQHASPTWDETFGENGSLKRTTTALFVVDGITSTMKSATSISTDRRAAFKAALDVGYWPFFKAHGDGGWSNETTFNDDGSFTVTSTSKEGNPNVIGFAVQDLTRQFS
jgi:hypothetical protein